MGEGAAGALRLGFSLGISRVAGVRVERGLSLVQVA